MRSGFENSNKANNYTRNNQGSIYDLLKKKKAKNNLKNKNANENNIEKKEKINIIYNNYNSNSRSNKNRINYSPGEINNISNTRSLYSKNPKVLANKEFNLKNNSSSNISNYCNDKIKNQTQDKNLKKPNSINNINNYSNKQNLHVNKETQMKLEKLKNFDSLADLLKCGQTDLIQKKPNLAASSQNSDPNLTEKVLNSYKERKKNEQIEKLNKEIERKEMKLLGKKTKNPSSSGNHDVKVSKDYIPETSWCAKCKGYHDQDAHKRSSFKKPLPYNNHINNSKSGISNEKKLESLENLVKKKKLNMEENSKERSIGYRFNNDLNRSKIQNINNFNNNNIKRNDLNKYDLIKKKKIDASETKVNYKDLNEIKIKKIGSENDNHDKIKKAINAKNLINNGKNYLENNKNNINKSNFVNNNEVSKENYTEDFEDIDYELENKYDYKNGNNGKYTAINNKSNFDNTAENHKINYSPSDNIKPINFTKNNFINSNNFNNNNDNQIESNIMLNKIDYSPSENFNMGKTNINPANKFEEAILLNKTNFNKNYNIDFNKADFDDDIKINKIGKSQNDSNCFNNKDSGNGYEKSLAAKAKENKSAEALKYEKIKETINKKDLNSNNNNLINKHAEFNKINRNINNQTNENSQDKSRLISEIKINSGNLQNKNLFNNNNNNYISEKSISKHHHHNQIKPGNSINTSNINSNNNNNNNIYKRDQLNNSQSIEAIENIKNAIQNKISKPSRAPTQTKSKTPNLKKSLVNSKIGNNSYQNNKQNSLIKPSSSLKYSNNSNNEDKSLNPNNPINSKIITHNFKSSNNKINLNPNYSIYNNPNKSINKNPNNNKPKSLDKFNNFTNKSKNTSNNLKNNNKLKKKGYLDETDRKFAKIFGPTDDFIEDGDEGGNAAEYRKYLDSINRKLSRGNNRNLTQDYSDGSISEANFEQIEREERFSSWYGDREDQEEERKQQEVRERRRIKKQIRQGRNSGEDDD
jgi:hypothetical protein